MATQKRPLSPDEKDEFADYTRRAMTNLGLANTEPEPQTAVQAVNDFVDHWQAETGAISLYDALDGNGPVFSRMGLRCML